MIPHGDEPVAPTSQRSEETTIPLALQESVLRHQKHLAALVESLRAAGVGEDMIDASVDQLLDSYRNELTAAVRVLVKDSLRA
jgi:hypothetical protein